MKLKYFMDMTLKNNGHRFSYPPLGEDGKVIFGAIDVDTYDNQKN